jgi:microcystin-dependent protein
MAVQFNIDSRFNADARYKKVLFGYDGQLLEVELNELQDILNARMADILDNVFGTRPLYAGTYTVSGGVLTIANEIVAGNHELILLTSSTISVANGDTIYLNIQDTTKTKSDSIKKYGDQNSSTTVTNSMLDSRVGEETTRRVQTTFMLTKTNTNPGTNIQLCSINSSGAVVLNATSNFADSSLYKEIRRLANEQITTNNLEPLKNVYGVVSVGGTNLTATAKADTLTFSAGTAITLSGNATTRTLTISSPNATTSVDGSMSAADKTKLNGIATGAEVNQNAFSNVMAGATNLASASKTDTLTVAGSNGISITGSGKTMTVSGVAASTSAVGTVQLSDSYTDPSTSKAATANAAKMAYDNAVAWAKGFGLGDIAKDISSTDLNAVDATGFYKGTTLTNAPTSEYFYVLNMKHSATFKSQTLINFYTGTIYQRVNNNGTWTAWKQIATTDVATQQTAGLLSAADKQKLDGMQAGATISQNAYATVIAGGTTMAATSTTDTLTLTPSGAIIITGSGKTATFGVNTASTSQAGVTTLTDSYTSASTTTAATANSAKMAYDNAVAWAKGYGLGDIAIDKTGTDLNGLDATGFYRADRANVSTLNTPSRVSGDHSYIYIVHTKHASGYYAQIAFDYNNVAMWKRTSTVGTWTAWKQIATTDVVTSSANGLMISTDKSKLDAINQALATTSTPTFAGMTLTGDVSVTSSSAHIKPASSGSLGFTNNAGSQWGLYVHDGAVPSAFTNKNTLDDGSGNATFIGNVTAPSFVSNVATGTAPLTVTSTTKVANLNVDQVDGYHFNQGVQTSDSPTFAALTVTGALTVNGSSYFKSTYIAAQGTATSSTNYNSYTLHFQSSYWNGTAAATYDRYMYLSSLGNITFTTTSGGTSAYIKDDGTFVTAGAYQSNAATGTAPLIVSSTTKVANLNADQVDGYDFDQSVKTTDSPSFSALALSVASGTAPMTVTSTTKVTNLNADMVDGYNFNQGVQTTDSPTFSKLTLNVAAGTAPMTVTSTTVVTNLNADKVDGYDFNQSVKTTDNVAFNTVDINVATGTAPMTVTSTTAVTNLNADMVDGYHASSFVQTSRKVSTSTGITGGGDLSADRTLAFDTTWGDARYANVTGQTFTGNITAPVVISNVATGTAPLTVTSTTKVANLNADMVDGYSFNQSLQTTDSPTFSKLTLNVAAGTAPMTVTSTTKVANLNADKVDGYDFNQSLQTTDSPTFAALTTTGAITAGTSVTITPAGTATSTTNYGSDAFQLQSSTWNGTAAVTNTRKITISSGNNLSFTNTSGSSVASLDNSGNWSGNQFQSTVATGTAPFTVASTTKVANLNADMVDGYSFNQSLQTTDSPTFAGLTASGTTSLATLTTSGAATIGNGLTVTAGIAHFGGGATIDSGYFEVSTYNTASYGTGKVQSYYDGNSFTWNINAKDGSNVTQTLTLKVSGATVWTSGNDGSGSNLDADLLDGQHGSYYASTAVATTSANGLMSKTDKSKLDGIASGADAIPTGVINQYAASTAPSGWLLCQGQAVSRTTYSALFGVISTTYGAGDGSTTFNLPNLQGKVPVGYNSGDSNFNALGKTGGEATHTLSTNEMPSHSHNVKFGGTFMSMSSGSTGYYNLTGWTTGGGAAQVVEDAAGGGAAHNNLQPYIVLNYIIKT